MSRIALALALWVLWLLFASSASAIDFYEIQIYTVETAPQYHLTLELHSNTITTATGQLAHQTLNPYQIQDQGTFRNRRSRSLADGVRRQHRTGLHALRRRGQSPDAGTAPNPSNPL